MIFFIIKQIVLLLTGGLARARAHWNRPPARIFVGYCPVWGKPLARRLDSLSGVNVVNIAYGFPEYDNTVGWGPQEDPDQTAVTVSIARLKSKKIPVLISLGGENCTRNDWENITDPAAFAGNVKSFCDEWGFSGVDLDYQTYEGDHSPAIPVIKALREALPRGEYLITYSGWPHIAISEKVIREAGASLDWVNACCYVIQTSPGYDPMQMIERYADLVGDPGKVIFGFRVQRRPEEPLMTLEQGVDFSRHVMDRELGGVMLWNLSDERTGDFIGAIDPILFPEGSRRFIKIKDRS